MFIHFLYISCGGTLVGLPTAELVDVSADDEQAWVSYDRQEGAAEGVLPQLRGIVPDDGIATIRAGKFCLFLQGMTSIFVQMNEPHYAIQGTSH